MLCRRSIQKRAQNEGSKTKQKEKKKTKPKNKTKKKVTRQCLIFSPH